MIPGKSALPRLSRMKTLPILMTLALLPGFAAAQFFDIKTRPIADLPDHAEFAEGTFAIFADFANQTPDGPLTLFLINDTKVPITLSAQDGDVYIKQEAQTGGKWSRSQPHRYSWCGNSYVPLPPIPAGNFLRYPARFDGWAPPVDAPEGEKPVRLPVRYRFYTAEHHDVISNEGEMPVSPTLIRIADSDAMAMKFGSVEKLAAYAKGERVASAIDHIDPRLAAFRELATRFPKSPIAKEALLVAVEDLSTPDPDADPDAVQRREYARSEAVRLLETVFSAN